MYFSDAREGGIRSSLWGRVADCRVLWFWSGFDRRLGPLSGFIERTFEGDQLDTAGIVAAEVLVLIERDVEEAVRLKEKRKFND